MNSYAIYTPANIGVTSTHIDVKLTFTEPVFEVWIASSFSVEIDTVPDEHRDADARGDRARSASHHCGTAATTRRFSVPAAKTDPRARTHSLRSVKGPLGDRKHDGLSLRTPENKK